MSRSKIQLLAMMAKCTLSLGLGLGLRKIQPNVLKSNVFTSAGQEYSGFPSTLMSYRSRMLHEKLFKRRTKSAKRVLNQLPSTTAEESETLSQIQVLQDMLFRIRQCNHVPYLIEQNLLDFEVEGNVVGKTNPFFAAKLEATPFFAIETEKCLNKPILTLTQEAGSTESERTTSVNTVMKKLATEGVIKGWRDEFYPVISSFYDEKVPLLVERASAPHLGVQSYGVHVNGYVKDNISGMPKKMWMARRSRTKSKYPGMLDHIVAGGQPYGMSPMQNVIKECEEEAGIPRELAIKARAAGAVSYEYYSEGGSTGSNQSGTIERACLFCYDLELPPDFVPKAIDGEVEEFFLWDFEQIVASMSPSCADPIKPNCYLVIIDFLLRWGFITPESPGYLDVLRELRSGKCS